MSLTQILRTADLRVLFAKEIAVAGGVVSEIFDDGERLFTRSTLPGMHELYAGETLQAGVALRAEDRNIWVHPYVYRQICRNGAILAHALQTRHILADESTSKADIATEVCEAVRSCCEEEAFTSAVADIRASRSKVADVAINLLPVLSRLRPELGTRIFRMIVERFFDGEDASRFGLMNAVTSVARDTSDPEVRWHLEELGGGIPVGHPPAPDPDDLAAEAALAN